ncbi:MAG: UpxY family transcription antiterminator [Candidatus Acidiferrales bacterium]
MEPVTQQNEPDFAATVLPAAYLQPQWYVAVTRARHEKTAAMQLGERGIESFLPLYESVRRWKDRRVKLELPLFPGYVFVRLPLKDRLRVLQIPSVARFVGFGGLPAPLGDAELESLRQGLGDKRRVEPHPYLTVGRRVRIRSGPFVNLEGILIRNRGNLRVVVSVELIQRSIAVEVSTLEIDAIGKPA